MEQISQKISDLSIQEENMETESVVVPVNEEICAICLGSIPLQETALLEGCNHVYCVTCILTWVTYHQKNPSCPQCKHPFSFLNVHRSIDGTIHDCMFEESVSRLLTAPWFAPLDLIDAYGDPFVDDGDFQEYCRYQFEDDDVEDEDEDEEDLVYYNGRSSVRSVGSSRGAIKEEAAKDVIGRRAKRALKRQTQDADDPHQSNLERLRLLRSQRSSSSLKKEGIGGLTQPTPEIGQ